MKILAVTPDVPWPCVGGARTRNAHLVQALADRHEVEVLALAWDDDRVDPPPGITMHAVPWRLPAAHAALERGEPGAWDQLTALDAEPAGVSYFDVPEMFQAIEANCARERPDIVVFAETAMARFRTAIPPQIPFVLDLHDVQSLKQERYVGAGELEKLKRFESDAARAATLVSCVSDDEAAAAQHLLGATNVHVIPNGVDTRSFPFGTDPGRDDDLVFTGSLYTQENVEALVWFVETVLPLIRTRRPRAVLHVVGARPSETVLRVVGDSVRLHANVPDVLPYLHSAGVAVVPLQHGGGTRLKILEAASAGRAIVTTKVGVQGLPMRDGEELVVVDDSTDFADAVLHLCDDPDLRVRRGAAARRIAELFDWKIIGCRWRELVESAA